MQGGGTLRRVSRSFPPRLSAPDAGGGGRKPAPPVETEKAPHAGGPGRAGGVGVGLSPPRGEKSCLSRRHNIFLFGEKGPGKGPEGRPGLPRALRDASRRSGLPGGARVGLLLTLALFVLDPALASARPDGGAVASVGAAPAPADGGTVVTLTAPAPADGGTVVTLPAPAGFLVRWPDGAREGRGGRLVLDLLRRTAAEAGVVRGRGAVRLARYVQLPGRPPAVRVVLDLAEDAEWRVVSVPGAVRVVVRGEGEGDLPVLPGGSVAETVYAGGGEEMAGGGDGAARPLAGRVVVLDPGHGGTDPGAVGAGGTLEKDVSLAVSLRLRDLLLAMGARVILTRADDTAVGLYERAERARSAGADLFLSVHANWNRWKSIRGVEAYYYPGGAGDRLAEAAVRHLAARLGVPGRGAMPADFVVLRETPAPAALVEVGFLSHPAEEALLRDGSYRERVAAALAAAVEEFLNQAGGGTVPVSVPERL